MLRNKNQIYSQKIIKNYKKENLENWKNIADYWLTENLRHVEDNLNFIKERLRLITKPNMTIVDMGCGSGFLYDLVKDLNLNIKYIGLDFNATFIDFLNKKYKDDDNSDFILVDFEEAIPLELEGVADIVVNFFNFIEVESFDKAFSIGVKLLNSSGIFSILTIEYAFLILAISKDMEDFKKKLREYEEIKESGYKPLAFQEIDLGQAVSEDLAYGSVFHSTKDYLQNGIKHKLELKLYDEIICTAKYVPKTYQYIEFSK